METKDIMQALANIHNNLCKMLVGSDNAIILGGSLNDMRALLATLNQEVESQDVK